MEQKKKKMPTCYLLVLFLELSGRCGASSHGSYGNVTSSVDVSVYVSTKRTNKAGRRGLVLVICRCLSGSFLSGCEALSSGHMGLVLDDLNILERKALFMDDRIVHGSRHVEASVPDIRSMFLSACASCVASFADVSLIAEVAG